jgi:sugar lactone lactonase YvrE
VLANIVGNEWDYVYHDAFTPTGIETVAHALAIRRGGRALPAEAAVYYPTPSSLVFAGGTIQWAWALGREGYADLRVERMTENVLTQAGIPAANSTEVPLGQLTSEAAWQPRVLAGTGEPGYLDGPARTAMFNAPAGVARAADGTLYITDQRNHRIRAISPGGIVSTLAGCGPDNTSLGSFRDGIGTDACFNAPTGIAVGPNGMIYVADTDNEVIREITPDGRVSTYAGAPGEGGNVDAASPLDARFTEPRGLAVAPDGTLYVADSSAEAIRKIDAKGVSTLATKVPRAAGVAVAADGTVYAVSASKGTIFSIKNGTAVLRAGAGLGDRDGPAASAAMRSEGSLIVENDRIVFSDSGNYKLRALNFASPAKPPNVVTLVSGSSAEQRTLHLPRGIARTPDGFVVVDAGNNRIVVIPRDIQPMSAPIANPGPTAP